MHYMVHAGCRDDQQTLGSCMDSTLTSRCSPMFPGVTWRPCGSTHLHSTVLPLLLTQALFHGHIMEQTTVGFMCLKTHALLCTYLYYGCIALPINSRVRSNARRSSHMYTAALCKVRCCPSPSRLANASLRPDVTRDEHTSLCYHHPWLPDTPTDPSNVSRDGVHAL